MEIRSVQVVAVQGVRPPRHDNYKGVASHELMLDSASFQKSVLATCQYIRTEKRIAEVIEVEEPIARVNVPTSKKRSHLAGVAEILGKYPWLNETPRTRIVKKRVYRTIPKSEVVPDLQFLFSERTKVAEIRRALIVTLGEADEIGVRSGTRVLIYDDKMFFLMTASEFPSKKKFIRSYQQNGSLILPVRRAKKKELTAVLAALTYHSKPTEAKLAAKRHPLYKVLVG